ncbi:MAG: hypothetical protein ABSC94_18490 [Polyangiaceae bacterium]|jgi:hypothetical protein
MSAKRWRNGWWIVAIGALGMTRAIAGCELLVDFDRSKIPEQGTDASFEPDSAIDGAPPIAADGGDAAMDAGLDVADGGDGADAASSVVGSDAADATLADAATDAPGVNSSDAAFDTAAPAPGADASDAGADGAGGE